ncbi:unnamed protein product [Closterium sp. Yama58-4]|nr:unnamed protein product [Closterium sp. Yama58-4]
MCEMYWAHKQQEKQESLPGLLDSDHARGVFPLLHPRPTDDVFVKPPHHGDHATDLALRSGSAGSQQALQAVATSTPGALGGTHIELQPVEQSFKVAVAAPSRPPDSESPFMKFHAHSTADPSTVACGGMEGVMTVGFDEGAKLESADAAAARSHARDSLLSQLEKLEAEWTGGGTAKTPRYSHTMLEGDGHHVSARGNMMMDMPSCAARHVSCRPTGWGVGRIEASGHVFGGAEHDGAATAKRHGHDGAAAGRHAHDGAAGHAHDGAAAGRHAHDGAAGHVQRGAATGHAIIDPSGYDMQGQFSIRSGGKSGDRSKERVGSDDGGKPHRSGARE